MVSVATAAAGLAVAAVMTLGSAAGASAIGAGSVGASNGTAAGQRVTTSQANASVDKLVLHPMPVGTVKFGRGSHRRLTVHLVMYGLTPGSSHQVDLMQPRGRRAARFSTLRANSVGQANSTLSSAFTGLAPKVSWLVIRMGARAGTLAAGR